VRKRNHKDHKAHKEDTLQSKELCALRVLCGENQISRLNARRALYDAVGQFSGSNGN
jgi:hypothetical protein